MVRPYSSLDRFFLDRFSLVARRLPAAAMLAVAAVAAGSAAATPFDTDDVPVSSKWVAHVDMDACVEASVVKRAIGTALDLKPGAEEKLDWAAKMLGFDPRTAFHSVTAFGERPGKEHATLIVRADVRREYLEKMVAKAKDHQTTTHRGRTLHSWTQKQWKGRGGRQAHGAFHADDTLVFAPDLESLERALDVLDGEAESIDENSPLAGRTKPGTILLVRGEVAGEAAEKPMLRQVEKLRLAIGEYDGKSFLRKRVVMRSEEAAEQAVAVGEGFKALMQLRVDDEVAQAARVVDGYRIARGGTSVTVAWDAEADDVGMLVEKGMRKWAAKMARRGGYGDCGKGGCGKGCGGGKCGKCGEGGRCGKDGCRDRGKGDGNSGKSPQRSWQDEEF